ncbi:protein Niban 1 isoform X2 [Esox lucius]|uniref:protein Niban 1 isoform X2 n=1 Tax=Esox lucius TaxID=8010 RepID=UPI00147706C8|nr:protein Niban 1 isoform X2 [Esox lucius]
MGASSSSLLDETKSNYIRGCAESELNNFGPHYKRQYSLAFCSQLQNEVEQHKEGHTQLLKQRDPARPEEVLYQDCVPYYDENKKWKERFVVVRANHSLECHDSQESFTKGVPARLKIQLTGGIVVTSEEKYTALVDKAFPDPNGVKEEVSTPLVVVPTGQFPVYLQLPYRRDAYFSFLQEDRRAAFISALKGCIRHQNHDCLRRPFCESQAFLKAIHFYRQEKGHYESWSMLIGCEEQVLANLVMEELLPSLQAELIPRLKGKKPEKKRVWFTTLEAAYNLVQDQLKEGLAILKEQCKETARSQEALIRSDMDQIASCKAFLQTKLQGSVSDQAVKFCSESVCPYLASILEELMSPVTGGFQGVRTLLEGEINALCQSFPEGGGQEGLNQALGLMRQASLEVSYQEVEALIERLQELRQRFKFSNFVRLVQSIQIDMQRLMDNAVYTFEVLLQSSLKDNPAKLTSAMEKAKLRVLKQFDYDSSTVRKRIFQEALVDITLPAIKRNLAPTCKPDLQKLDQYIFADYTNFIQVENVYEDILLNILTNEVNKVVQEAASLRKNNLMVDSTDLQSISQSSLIDSRTLPLSTPSSPAISADGGLSRLAEQAPSPLLENGRVQEDPRLSPPNPGRVEWGTLTPDMSAHAVPVVITKQSETSVPAPGPGLDPVQTPVPVSDPCLDPIKTPVPASDPGLDPVQTPVPAPDPGLDPVQTPVPAPDPGLDPVQTPVPVSAPIVICTTDVPVPSSEADVPVPSSEADVPVPSSEADVPVPSSEADVPVPSSEVDVPVPSSEADVPVPSSEADVPVPSSEAIVPVPSSEADVPVPGGTEGKPDTVTDSSGVDAPVNTLPSSGVDAPVNTLPSSGVVDRAVYLILPTGLKEGEPVHLTEDEENDEEEECLGTVTGDTEEHHISKAIETVDSGSFHSDTPPEMESSGLAQTSSFTEARDTEAASQTGTARSTGSDTHPGGSEDREAVPSVSGVTGTESQDVLPVCITSASPPEGEEEEEEEEEAVPLDSVKAIRDLVVEVIEVEELVQRCPSAHSNSSLGSGS